ncbi:MAG: hypothetical protein KF901_33420 [Myxococcales bacterium]|nr:hypothetical protein [Myxococcales bacterium]
MAAASEAAAAAAASAAEALRAELEAAKEGALAALRAELEAAHAAVLAAKIEELTAEKDKALEEATTAHSKELALLGRKLADTEGKLEEVRGQLAALGEAHAQRGAELDAERQRASGVEAELAAEQSKSAGLTSDLAKARDRITSLEGDVATRTSRIAALEAMKEDLERQRERLRDKVATDDALLERVRRAMSIGLGLLEDQKNNRVDDVIDAE